MQQLSQNAHLPCQDIALSLIQVLNFSFSNCVFNVLIIMVNLIFLSESCIFLLFEIVPAAR